MKKIIVLAIVLCIFAYVPIASSETDTVTGTFTPISTGVSIYCNNTAPAFGNINLGANYVVSKFNVSSDGDTNCSVKMTAGYKDSNTWELVAGTSSPATNDEYCVNMAPNGSGYVDVYTEQTVASDLPPTGVSVPWNYTYFNLKLFVSDYTTEGTPGEQTMYANLTAAAIS